VDEIRDLLRRLDGASDPTERERLVSALMHAVYRLGRDNEWRTAAREASAVLAPAVRRISGGLGHFAGSIETSFVLGVDEWEDIAWRRSALEFLLALLPVDDAEWLRGQVEPDAYDNLIRRYSHDFGYLRSSKIPPGIPTSHWWWWAPLEPGEELTSGPSKPR
jgi:hypothetical protein